MTTRTEIQPVGQAASPVREETGRRPAPRVAAPADCVGQAAPPVRTFKALNPYKDVAIARRHLPHWRQSETTYFITWRLADSIPMVKLRAWQEERDHWLGLHPRPWSVDVVEEYRTLFPARIEEMLDQGMGSCVLSRAAARDLVEECLLRFDGQRYDLWQYIVMPNHVHVLVTPRRGFELSTLLHTWKGFTAKAIHRLLGGGGALWQDENYDHIVRDEAELHRIAEYIQRNPEKARLPAGTFSLMHAGPS